MRTPENTLKSKLRQIFENISIGLNTMLNKAKEDLKLAIENWGISLANYSIIKTTLNKQISLRAHEQDLDRVQKNLKLTVLTPPIQHI